jgi:hypothetical protein
MWSRVLTISVAIAIAACVLWAGHQVVAGMP